jgi:glycosyltransferase involved in cell wall biosynthesis
MPAYNAEQYIAEAIESILNQTFTDFEFIIINDGSTDNTVDIIKNYSDPRIVFLENEQNSGICVTLNKGLDAARGKYIARMDSDDISVPERLEEQVKFMDQHQDIGVSGSDVYVFGKDVKAHIFTQLHDADLCVAGLMFNPCLAHPSVIFRKDIIDKYSIKYDENFAGLEDFVMWWNFAQVSRITNINKPLIKYRVHNSQETKKRTNHVYEMSNLFRVTRYTQLGLKLTPEIVEVLNDYSYGNFENFTVMRFAIFVDAMANICNRLEYPILTTRRAMRITASKGIAYILSQSPQLAKSKKYLLTKAYISGVIPFIWYMKYLKSMFN